MPLAGDSAHKAKAEGQTLQNAVTLRLQFRKNKA